MSQSLVKFYGHIIFSTKNRACFLKDKNIREEMYAYLASILKKYDSHPLIVGGAEDHVHILCIISKNHPFMKIIGEIKRNSSKWIKTKHEKYSRFQWQNGYGAFSVSFDKIEGVRNYINNQDKHHQKTTFKDEFRDFLIKQKIKFDERYLWE